MASQWAHHQETAAASDTTAKREAVRLEGETARLRVEVTQWESQAAQARRRLEGEAAQRAEIYDDIMAMPQGFDTYVGERGALLSGGQKQRISIARIFLKNPPILILDEATSALDSVTEAKIQRAFDELAKGRTTLIIAHRLSTVRSASRILVIRDGVITEEGAHQELLAKGGDYAQLYNTQNLHG